MADGFLGRWSRRKIDAKDGRPLEEPPPAPAPALTPAPAPTSQNVAAPAPADAPTPEPAPTMADVQALKNDSDFSRFTGSQVDPQVRNAAMKKLFADPHFNVMDGLDIYIDDYGKPDPMPESMLRNLASSQFLGLFKDEKTAQPGQENPQTQASQPVVLAPDAPSPQDSVQIVAQSGPTEPPHESAVPPAPDADPDLRLQQDPAPGPPSSGGGAQ